MINIKLGVGKIPLNKLCDWLNFRNYNKNMTLEYIKKIYNIDVAKNIELLEKNNKIYFDFHKNMFKKFELENIPNKPDDGTKKWFNYYGRRRYENFLLNYILFGCDFEKKFDEILNIECDVDFHHIFEIEDGGNNNLKNIVSINPFFHKLLRNNPLKYIEKYCFQSLDYLRYLIKWKFKQIYYKYKINTYENFDDEIRFKFMNIAIEKEMELFYNKIIDEHKMTYPEYNISGGGYY